MPYDFVKPGRLPTSRDRAEGVGEGQGSEEEDAEGRIQRELKAWRLHMREERQQRLLAAAARAERTRNAEASSASCLAAQEVKGEGGRHGDAPPHRQELTALQQYRRELGEVASGVQQGRRNPWTAAAPVRRQRRLKTHRVTYHEARSVLREYIHRPPPPSPNLRKTPTGALRAYKDALAASARAFSEAPATAPARWHQQPLRSISARNRRQEASKPNSVATTRSMTLRRRHAESSAAARANSPAPKRGHHRGAQPRNGTEGSKLSPRLALEPTPAYRSAMGQLGWDYKEELQRREGAFHFGRELSPQSSASSWRPSPRRSTTQPMATYPVASPQPRPPSHAPYIRHEEETEDVFHASMRTSPAAEVLAVPPTPAFRGSGGASHGEEQPRRESSPLLRELLSTLALSSPSLYRPDLYQGRTRPEVSPVARSVEPRQWPMDGVMAQR
ncbi:uncharacterized protein Tco025E_01153 [Trypanosoma conorhini]|uniref:Uncharacterized protein n=1 Tax=Trypanosoma conorhini TaxID=83891 RepID=A0A3S5IUL2_9TRYP|nr:uncharacterized protein Tco025E_01153 [Trypanosoma conorhini]RNF26550.1 hypothetical protein Tco025E_01153 [Trypanosoma conorhini]